MSEPPEILDTIWVLSCAGLVLLMQAGFCCLESGLVRNKNTINVAFKNVVDFFISSTVFWICGFAIMFGSSIGESAESNNFFFLVSQPYFQAFFLFQLVFCGTACTITSGAVAERIRFSGYLIIAFILSCLIYPVFGRWAWAGLGTGELTGWLGSMGFIDFAGSTVVHSIGGWVALAAILVIGPRLNRFGPAAKTRVPYSLPISTLGVFLLWVGWYGFNAGSLLKLSDEIPSILINTTFAGIAGGVMTLALSWKVLHQPRLEHVLNGTLAGFVAITASCNIMTPPASILIGLIGGALCFAAIIFLEKQKIDDVVGAVPVHAVAGVWGTLAVALFSNPDQWGTGLSRLEQLGVQMTGVLTCFVWAFGAGYGLLWLINRWYSLRVKEEEEMMGLDLAEHSFHQLAAMLREKETQFSSVVENTLEGIITIDAKGIIETFNPSAERLFGYEASEMIGQRVNRLMPEPYKSEHDEYVNSYIKTGQAQIIGIGREVVGLRKDGSTFPLDLGVSEMIINERCKFIGTLRDLTEQKKAEEKIQMLSTAVHQSPDSVMITGPDGKIKYVNHSFMISTGYILEEVVGEKPSILKSGKHTVQFYKKLWDTILAGNIWRGDICNRKKNGDLYWQLQSIFPVKNIEGVITHFIAIKIDDTERLRAEEKLKEYSAELERSNQDLNEFASIASHDLQEPLRKLTIFSDRLQEKYADVLDDTGRGYVERILKAAIRMQNFIDDLLKFSRTKTHPQPFELVNLEEIVSETLMGLEAMIGRTNGQVEIKGLPVIEAEKFHMQQLFQNLITNALKFHKEGEPPVVVINSRREEHGLWTITVEDNGIGFDEKYVGKIFKPFQRLHGMNVYAGSGIGLAICKKIVERHGGSISAKSQPQKGATFFITLPEKQPAEGEDVER